jgi:hypothetical protein
VINGQPSAAIAYNRSAQTLLAVVALLVQVVNESFNSKTAVYIALSMHTAVQCGDHLSGA